MPDFPPNQTASSSSPDGLSPDFLALLCCPVCPDRPSLRYAPAGDAAPAGGGDGGALVCDRCGRVYPIENGLPDLRPRDGVSDAPAPAAGAQ